MKKKIFIILIVLVTVSLIADCRLFVMMGKNTNILSDANTNDTLSDGLEEFQFQGGRDGDDSLDAPYNNNDGWKLVCYSNSSTELSEIYSGSESAYGSQTYDTAESEILATTNNHLIMGHVRRTSSGASNIVDPHPFIFNTNGIDYTFAQNDGVDKDEIRTLIENADDDLPEEWLETHSPNTYGHGDWDDETVWDSYVVDSEIYFLWIMLKIHLNDYNIYEGMQQAISLMDYTGIENDNRNFVFSDGVDIYAYRNSTGSRADHHLKYRWVPSEKFWMIMSTFPPEMPTTEIEMIPNDGLLYLSATGKSVLFKDFSTTTPEYCRALEDGWNWEAFPIFPINTSDGQVILQDLTNYGITDVEGIDFTATYILSSWNMNFNFNNDQFYKTKLTNETPDLPENNVFSTIGEMRDPTLSNATNIVAGNLYWIGYNLLPSQNIKDAFGSNWDKVSKVWAEDWYFDKQHNERGGKVVPSNSTTGKTMEFAKGYIVKFIDSFSSFTWNYSHQPSINSVPIKSTIFTYDETPTYEVKDVMSVEIDEDILEIGVFQDGICKGAAVVDELPVQIIAYTDPEGGDLTFQVVSDRRSRAEFREYSILDKKNNSYNIGSLPPRSQPHSIIQLGKGDFNTTQVNDNPELHQNYPNPFNPVTEISFDLKTASKVKLEVFNIKGQKVKTLRVAYLEPGNHSVTWSGIDDTGQTVSSGIYMYRLTTNQVTQTQKMILLK